VCSIRSPVEKTPLCLLNLRMLLLGKLYSRPRHQRRNRSGVAESLANGQLALNAPSLAPPVCVYVETTRLTPEAEPCRTPDVNRESGTESASRRWLKRVVRPRQYYLPMCGCNSTNWCRKSLSEMWHSGQTICASSNTPQPGQYQGYGLAVLSPLRADGV
jgi:hypothetical protein